ALASSSLCARDGGGWLGRTSHLAVRVANRRRLTVEYRVDQRAIGRERANGIRPSRVARERERLAPAAAEVDVFARAAAARLPHPLVAAVCAKGARIVPDPLNAVLAHVVECERRDL